MQMDERRTGRTTRVAPWAVHLAAIVIGLVGSGSVFGQVSVTGDSPNGKSYTWTVKNAGIPAVVSVRIPHYSGMDFRPPEGWTMDKNQAGSFVCRAESDEAAISRGTEQEFSLTVDLYQDSSVRGKGTVQVGLSDGSSVLIENVLVPVAASKLEKLAVPVFLLACFGIFIWRKQRKEKPVADEATKTS